MKILKHTICLLLFILIALPESQAQEAQSFGVKAGLTISSLSNPGNLHLRPGAQVGGYAKFGGGEPLFFKAELLATQKGSWNWNNDNPSNFSLYYIDLPIMFGIDIVRNLSLNLGIQPSILVAGTYRSSVEGNISTRAIGGDLTRFDYATLIGAEYIINDDWFLGFRYNHGWVPIQTYYEEFTIRNEGRLLKNRGFQLYAGLRMW